MGYWSMVQGRTPQGGRSLRLWARAAPMMAAEAMKDFMMIGDEERCRCRLREMLEVGVREYEMYN